MSLKIGEQTINERLTEARLQVRRIAAAHDVALKKLNRFDDTARHLVETPEIKSQREKLLTSCQDLWKELDEANQLVRWYVWQINEQLKRK